MSLVLPNSYGKSHLVHLIDTPGHVNFVDEVASAIRLVDGILLVVDVVEGVSTVLPFALHCRIHAYTRSCVILRRSSDMRSKKVSKSPSS